MTMMKITAYFLSFLFPFKQKEERKRKRKRKYTKRTVLNASS